jgi:hypothetical protein
MRLDLTGDRPLTLREARKLRAWWQGFWSVELIRVARNRFNVIATKR